MRVFRDTGRYIALAMHEGHRPVTKGSNMDLDLRGKTAVVTGASMGIGLAIARDLALEGVQVGLVARNKERLERAAADIHAAGGLPPAVLCGDMGSAEDIERVLNDAQRSLGPIDILVNNAGSSPSGRIHDTEDAVWMKSINLKLMGYVRCARKLVPDMRARRWGRVINIIGRSGHQPRAEYIAGGAVNAALLNFTKALADETAKDNVLVVGVNPGPIQTERWDSLVSQGARSLGKSEDAVQAAALASVPLGRIGTPEEVSALVAFLCSDRASFITGTLIDVDGGGTRCI
jgi:3-oxoacyl-[acyl-carrier protein] reductase